MTDTAPIQLFDSHFHIIDPRFPIVANQGYLPDPFTITAYRQQTTAFQVIGGAVVSGSFQGYDQTYLLEALSQLGPDFVGVTQLPATVTDEEILSLHKAGVRAVRFNIRRGGNEVLKHLEQLARRVSALAGWHAEIYIDAQDLPALLPLLSSLPRICIDHLGLSRAGFKHLLQLVEQGAYVKASGFGRVDFDVAEALQAISAINPQALLFGTDLPCPRAPRPFRASDITLIMETLNEQISQQVLYANAIALYKNWSFS